MNNYKILIKLFHLDNEIHYLRTQTIDLNIINVNDTTKSDIRSVFREVGEYTQMFHSKGWNVCAGGVQ